MEAFPDMTHMWDLSQGNNFSQLPDDDFLAILQKQFPPHALNDYNNNGFTDGVNPQNISRYSLPSLTPPSEDSSPSPPGQTNDSYQNSYSQDDNEDTDHDSALKRKASDESLNDEPNPKNQHTTSKKGAAASSSRRKSATGTGQQKDDNRLLKRKEQNRAAQRAFRERKEKHVKDLEDKVAALEAENDKTTSENLNLRDLLARVQSENIALKQTSFTFSVPKPSAEASTSSYPQSNASTSSYANSPEAPLNLFSPGSSSESSSSTPAESSKPSPQMPTGPPSFDWGSLTSFDPTMLNLLDETPQATATDSAMQMDFGFGQPSKTGPYTTIASNPNFMSFASSFDTPSTSYANHNSSNDFNFDMNTSLSPPSLNGLSPWSTSPSGSSLDDLFSPYMTTHNTTSPDYNAISGAVSPIVHHASPPSVQANTPAGSSASSSSSPSSFTSPPPQTSGNNNGSSRPNLFATTIRRSSSTTTNGKSDTCPKNKAEVAAHIEAAGASPFTTSATSFGFTHKPASGGPAVTSTFGPSLVRRDGPLVMCDGTKFPPTQASADNVEVLTAWRSIMNTPNFKDMDITHLCSEFSSKARCDGTKVVLEPEGVNTIMEQLTTRKAAAGNKQ